MICTVSTVKDSFPNVKNFVNRNLSAGADHMFIFLEAEEPAVYEFLNAHSHVTVISTDEAYWHGHRPASLNARQTINANLINCLLTLVDRVEWLFHIDGDECLDLDRDALNRLDERVEYVRLTAKESVSTSNWLGTGQDYFKRLLTDEELALLRILDVIDAARNGKYFHGHVSGKIGVRPSLDYEIRIHEAKCLKGDTATAYQADWLHILHYDSFTQKEFLRKWSAHIDAGLKTKFRVDKEEVRSGVKAVLDNGSLDADKKRRYLTEIYERRVEDDFETLLELGYIEKLDPGFHSYSPQAFPPEDLLLVDRCMAELLDADKRFFRPASANWKPVVMMDSVQRELQEEDRYRPASS